MDPRRSPRWNDGIGFGNRKKTSPLKMLLKQEKYNILSWLFKIVWTMGAAWKTRALKLIGMLPKDRNCCDCDLMSDVLTCTWCAWYKGLKPYWRKHGIPKYRTYS